MIRVPFRLATLLRVLLPALLLPASAAVAAESDLLSLGAGALPVVEPPSYGGWEILHLIDDAPGTGWASVEGQTQGQTMVFELPATATLERFEFDDAACLDGEGRGTKGLRVSVSDTSKDSGFATVLEANLSATDGQELAAQAKVPGRFVRIEILGNQGAPDYVELCSVRAYGAPPPPVPAGDVSGTYESSYSTFHVRQEGTALVGCYEYDGGLLSGSVEGRVMKLTWQENGGPDDNGPAVMVFAPDGKSFTGHWWSGTDRGRAPSGAWDGKKVSAQVGSCPNWSGSVGGEVERALARSGRALLYGIEFDVDSATIRTESRPILDDVARALAVHADWKLAIEGHTDATGSAVHNQRLSEARAASVRDYLAAHGIDAARLTSAGFGAGRPLADNATELGRARNRRVEIVRR